MIASLSLILLCQLVGEIFARTLPIAVPAPVIGLVLLFMLLVLRDQFKTMARGPLLPGNVEGTAKAFLAHLSLLFVPAGVGVVQQIDLIASHGLTIFAVLAASVVITLVVTVLAFLGASRMLRKQQR